MPTVAKRDLKSSSVQARIERCVSWAAERLDALERSPRSLAEAPDSQFHVILRRAGYRRRTPKIQEQLQNAFQVAGIRTYPEMTDPSVERDTRIYFLRNEIEGLAQRRVLFETERLLEDFLVHNFHHLPAFRGLRLRARQYRFPGSQRTIDLLCEDRRKKILVAVELKHGPPDRGLPTQMIDYMIELDRLSTNEGWTGFRGLVVTGQPDSRIEEDLHSLCAERSFRVDWLLYQAGIELRPRKRRS